MHLIQSTLCILETFSKRLTKDNADDYLVQYMLIRHIFILGLRIYTSCNFLVVVYNNFSKSYEFPHHVVIMSNETSIVVLVLIMDTPWIASLLHGASIFVKIYSSNLF